MDVKQEVSHYAHWIWPGSFRSFYSKSM